MEYAKAMTQVLEKEGLPLQDEGDLDPIMEVCWWLVVDGYGQYVCRCGTGLADTPCDARTHMCTQAIGDRRFVFLGEASHGTHEYYSAYFLGCFSAIAVLWWKPPTDH